MGRRLTAVPPKLAMTGPTFKGMKAPVHITVQLPFGFYVVKAAAREVILTRIFCSAYTNRGALCKKA